MINTIIPIQAPSLNSTEYAEDLSGVFDNINTNFSILANKDFIKGDTGESLMIESVKLFENDNFTTYGEEFKTYIEKTYDEDVRKDIIIDDGTVLNLFDNIKKYGAELHLIYAYHKDSNDKIIKTTEQPISSLYFVFLDGRFANDKLKYIDWTDNLNISDLSGVFIVENGVFKMLPNAFPTMYYEKGVGLCWKFNGNKTGLLVQGPKGNDGKNSPLLIVKASLGVDLDNQENNGQLTGPATQYYTKTDAFTDFESEDYADYDGCAAIILNDSENNSGTHDFYFGILVHNTTENKLLAYCDSTTGINTKIENASFLNFMRSIDIYNTDGDNSIRGLFVPIKNDGEKTSAHLISATNAIEKNENSKKDLIVTHVDDLNDIDISKVERYLYVKVNKFNNVITEVSDNSKYSAELKKMFTDLKDNCNYILKYKLTNISYSVLEDFPYYNESGDFDGTIDSRFFANYAGTALTDKNTDCFEYGQYMINNSISKEKQLLNSMPDSFKARLDNSNSKPKGIYRWDLYREVIANHDSINIPEYKKDSGQSLLIPFNTIYTTDLTPNADSEIMWFNGISIVENKYIYGFGYDFNTYTDSNDPDKDLFKVIKCVSVFNETNIDTDLSSDTALNINYNVNVIGSTNNFKRDLAVSGDITGKNLNISGDITGANEKFKVNGSDGTIYAVDGNFSVNSGGGITTKGGIIAGKNRDFEIKSSNGAISTKGNITTDGNISAAGDITATDGKFTDVNVKGNITTTGAISAASLTTSGDITVNGTIVGSKKYQYVPIISDISCSYTSDYKTLKILNFTLDPGNHIIYGIKFVATKPGFDSYIVLGQKTYNFKPLNTNHQDAINTIKTIALDNNPIVLDISNYDSALGSSLRVYVIYDGYFSSYVNTDVDTEWEGILIHNKKIT